VDGPDLFRKGVWIVYDLLQLGATTTTGWVTGRESDWLSTGGVINGSKPTIGVRSSVTSRTTAWSLFFFGARRIVSKLGKQIFVMMN
jgi:hypothetical protein